MSPPLTPAERERKKTKAGHEGRCSMITAIKSCWDPLCRISDPTHVCPMLPSNPPLIRYRINDDSLEQVPQGEETEEDFIRVKFLDRALSERDAARMGLFSHLTGEHRLVEPPFTIESLRLDLWRLRTEFDGFVRLGLWRRIWFALTGRADLWRHAMRPKASAEHQATQDMHERALKAEKALAALQAACHDLIDNDNWNACDDIRRCLKVSV